MRTKFLIWILVGMSLITCELRSQTSVMKLWGHGIPNSILDSSYKEIVNRSESGDRVAQIFDPELHVFLPTKGNATKTAILIIPGGGYTYVTMTKEGSKVAQWLNANGIAAFVLKYRLPSDKIMEDKSVGPLQDAQEAIRIIRRHSKEWNIDPHSVGVIGFSAGGHLASTLCTHFNDSLYQALDNTSSRPDFSILMYPVISMDAAITHNGSRERLLGINPSDDKVKKFSNELQVSTQTPPAFLVHAMDDATVPVENSVRYFLALRSFHIPSELHIYQSGGHGFSLTDVKGTESDWMNACIHWLQFNGWQ
mgnify:CR=1 FL=1